MPPINVTKDDEIALIEAYRTYRGAVTTRKQVDAEYENTKTQAAQARRQAEAALAAVEQKRHAAHQAEIAARDRLKELSS